MTSALRTKGCDAICGPHHPSRYCKPVSRSISAVARRAARAASGAGFTWAMSVLRSTWRPTSIVEVCPASSRPVCSRKAARAAPPSLSAVLMWTMRTVRKRLGGDLARRDGGGRIEPLLERRPVPELEHEQRPDAQGKTAARAGIEGTDDPVVDRRIEDPLAAKP